MPEVNSPASASPSMIAGLNPPSPQTGDAEMSGRIPGAGLIEQAGAADAKLNSDIQALRGMEAALADLSESYPTASKALRDASQSLQSAQRMIVSSPGLQEPPVPNTTA